jgi:hypothetical protein
VRSFIAILVLISMTWPGGAIAQSLTAPLPTFPSAQAAGSVSRYGVALAAGPARAEMTRVFAR